MMTRRQQQLLFAAVLLVLATSDAFYLPGVAPHDYARGERVELKVNKLDSIKTQLPYEYYSLPFCKPTDMTRDSENLGEILSGDEIESSLYNIGMRVDEACKILCAPRTYSKEELAHFADKIKDEYRVHWIVDNLPSATKYVSADDTDTFLYEKGFPLGYMNEGDGKTYINNHVRLILQFHEPASGSTSTGGVATAKRYRVVGFEVEAVSVKHKLVGKYSESGKPNKLATCTQDAPPSSDSEPQPVSGDLSSEADRTIIWTYDVQWVKSDVRWASRWDVYLKMTDSKIHWFSIVNSIIVVLFLASMIAVIMVRTLYRDLARYNEEDDDPEASVEETGWKLVYGDVFRPPQRGGFLAVLVGSGVQVCAMTVLTLVFAVLGFLSPANRGGLMTALLLLFVLMGALSGYYSTRLYKTFKLEEWKRNTFWTAIAFPGLCFTVFFILNLFVWGKKSSGAVPFGTLVALLVLWFGISVPLVYIGAYFASKRDSPKAPCSVNHIHRIIPESNSIIQSNLTVLAGGVFPFAAIFIEIFFIMSSVWLHQFYYMFGFLFVVFGILLITCAEISIVMCYFQLCAEDYHWWWRSFLTSGSSGLYLFLYSMIYFSTKLEITSFVPTLLYFGYMFLVSVAFALLTGTIGFYATNSFVHRIYSAIKVD